MTVSLFVFAFTLNSMPVLFPFRFVGLLALAVGFGVFLFFGWRDDGGWFLLVFDHVDCLHIDFLIFFKFFQLFPRHVDFPFLSIRSTSVCCPFFLDAFLNFFFLDRSGWHRVLRLCVFGLLPHLHILVDPVSDCEAVLFSLLDVLVGPGEGSPFNFSHSKSLINQILQIWMPLYRLLCV